MGMHVLYNREGINTKYIEAGSAASARKIQREVYNTGATYSGR